MPTLPKDLRSKLEKAVIAARDEATEGARVALTALGVGDAKKPSHLDADGEALRRRLRARGRQAGDLLKPDDSQETEHLVQECAYEHWHRMLFARFLAENELLRHPEMGVAVSLEECEELARGEGLDLWELAASFAQHMLPEVFRQDNPVLHLRLPTEARNKLTAILGGLQTAVFTADDSLGWTYQFWQTKRKKEVNDSDVKIGADEISPVTQLFTEDYMVEFLLHNTLGAWWAGKLGPIEAASEEEARAKAALAERDGIDVTWTYLRFIQDEETKTWKPAAGSFEGWPEDTKNITFLDPCMGSGHFPVFALPILARLRIEEENLSSAEAVYAVLRDNIHGLELDPRCCQIGAFNLALTAWKLADHQPLPPLHIACCGIAPQAKLADWVSLAGDNDKLRRGMERLYKLFEQAPVLGSLINPRFGGGDLLEASFHELQPLLDQAMAREAEDDVAHEMAVTARGLVKAAEMLAGQFTLTITNVPYLGRTDQCSVLQEWSTLCSTHGSSELATTFIERLLQFGTKTNNTIAVVSPHEWWFLRTWKKFRLQLLTETTWRLGATLGEEAWESFGIRGPKATLLIIETQPAAPTNELGILDALPVPTIPEKIDVLRGGDVSWSTQEGQKKNPDYRITTDGVKEGKLLSEYAESLQGVSTADAPRFVVGFWEAGRSFDNLQPFQGSISLACEYGGRESALDFESLRREVMELGGAVRGRRGWGRTGVAIRQLRSLYSTVYSGDVFDTNVAVIVPRKSSHFLSIYAFCSSPLFTEEVRRIDKKKNVTNGTMVKVPFDLAHWQKVATEKYPNGLPKPHSDDPTQWLFNGHPKGSEQPLQVAVARLLGYRWPRQTGSSFPDCPALDSDGLEVFADEDGIVCLTPVRGEDNAADRLRELLRAALGSFDERQLIAAAGKKDSKSKSLELWLRDEFFDQHCDIFDKRPFIWHLWDGRKDGFHALVNYHQLTSPNGAGRRTLETLTYGYLGDWITRQTAAVSQGESGADDRLAAALELKGLLEKILAGDPPYDLFVRWKPLHEQAIGWAPDLNDGVRLNARPFLATDLSRGKKNTGLFRSKVNLKWTKDRGKEPERVKADFPWFWSWDETAQDFAGGSTFDGNRWNDLHYTTAFKQAARDRKKS